MAKTPEIDIRKPTKNYIINGDMAISQRQTSFAAIAGGAYSLDRWRYDKLTTVAVHTASQDTDVPTVAQAGYLFQNSMRLMVTTIDATIGSADLVIFGQRVEGYNWAKLAQKTFSLSFWVKATIPGIYCVAFSSSTGDRSYIAEYTINTTNTWEHKTVTVAASPAAGTWNYTNGTGLRIQWTLAGGLDYQSTAGSWITTDDTCTSNQVNGVATLNADFRITGVMLNEGQPDLEFKTFGGDIEAEIRACQRYFEKSYNMANFGGATSVGGYVATSVPAAGVRVSHPYIVRKRSSTVAYSTWSVVLGTPTNVSKDTAGNIAITFSAANESSAFVEFTQTAGDARAYWHWYAESEL